MKRKNWKEESERWKELYYDEKGEYERWKDTTIGLSICLVAFLILSTVLGFLMADNVDIDDRLAPYLCEQHNQTLKSVDYGLKNGFLDDLKIVCESNPQETPLEDGYLFTIDEGVEVRLQ